MFIKTWDTRARFLIQMVWGEAGECGFLVSSLVMFLLWRRGYIEALLL